MAISIHALRAEGDRPEMQRHRDPSEISIHALRAEGDASFLRLPQLHSNFYPRPPCGGRLEVRRFPPTTERFLSTPSVRRATPGRRQAAGRQAISIHALRAEGDRSYARVRTYPENFYPRPPCGGRR